MLLRARVRATCRVCARAVAGVAMLVCAAVVSAESLRIVSYNIAADIDGYTTARPGLMTVLQGIGDEATYAPARPIDVLTLQETTSNVTTVAPIVADLNALYGANTYAMSTYQATVNGGNPSTGNGPNALIYKQTSLQLVAQPPTLADAVGIGTPSTSGFPRQPVRYQFRPVGGTAADDFYVYVSHYKASTGSTNETRRNVEAQAIRADAATLPPAARILYTGDFNMYSSSEPAYVTLLSAGPGQGFDPLNRPGNWNNTSAFKDIMTYSSTDLHVRFDFQLLTQNVLVEAGGLRYVAGSYHTFGVNGTNYQVAVDDPSNTALPGLPNRSAVLAALVTASDHLPVVADYELTLAPPAAISVSPAALERWVVQGGSLADDVITISNTGQAPLHYSVESSAGWLSATPATGTTTGEADPISIVYAVVSLAVGEYPASIVVSDPDASNSPQSVAVTLHVVLSNGDFDQDGDADMSDFAQLQRCFSDLPPMGVCVVADMNVDNVVEQADLAMFLNCMAGAQVAPGC